MERTSSSHSNKLGLHANDFLLSHGLRCHYICKYFLSIQILMVYTSMLLAGGILSLLFYFSDINENAVRLLVTWLPSHMDTNSKVVISALLAFKLEIGKRYVKFTYWEYYYSIQWNKIVRHFDIRWTIRWYSIIANINCKSIIWGFTKWSYIIDVQFIRCVTTLCVSYVDVNISKG